MLYVCMFFFFFFFLFVCLLMKGSFRFDPNDAQFTQKIEECMGRVINCIQPKTVQDWLKNSLQMCSVALEKCILFTGD